LVLGAFDPGAFSLVSVGEWFVGELANLASPPDYILRPQYQTREQKRISAMKDQIGDLGAFLKGMQARLDEQHQAVVKKLDANSVVLQELFGWKPKVQAEVEQL
jgi:hypothetical protein